MPAPDVRLGIPEVIFHTGDPTLGVPKLWASHAPPAPGLLRRLRDALTRARVWLDRRVYALEDRVALPLHAWWRRLR